MKLELEEMTRIQKEFKEDFPSFYNQYVKHCAFTILKCITRENPHLELRDNETLSDICLFVSLRNPLPKDLELPSEYQNLRVFYHY